jgi:hypothetical protein
MLQSLGRGLGVCAKRRACMPFYLTSSLSSHITYARNDTVATYRDADGKLQRVAGADIPRFDHDEAGNPLGLLIETTTQNKITLHNTTPYVTITGVSTTGTATIDVITDSIALSAAGMEELVTEYVFRVIGGASGGDVILPGTTGNTSVHSFSAYARIVSGVSATLTHTGSSAGTQTITGSTWARYRLENQTISGSSVQMKFAVPAGVTMLFILTQMEQNRFCTSPIVTSGGATTRQRDEVYITLAGKDFWSISEGHLLARYRPLGQTGVDQHPIIAHSGNSNNTIGFRLSGSTFFLQGNVRAGGSSKMASSDATVHIAGVETVSLVTWKSGQAVIARGASQISGTYSGDPSGLTTLQIGARHSGNDPFCGHVSMFEVGKKFLTDGQISGKLL